MVVAFRDDGGEYIGLNSYFTAMDYAVIEEGKDYVTAIREALADYVDSYAGNYNGDFVLNPASEAEDEGDYGEPANRFVFEISDKRKSKRTGNGITYSGTWVNGHWETLNLPTKSGDADIRRESRKLLRRLDFNLTELFNNDL